MSSQSQPRPLPACPFRIVRDESDLAGKPEPAADPHALSPAMTLSEFYERFALPICRENKNDPKTIKQDRETLGYWRRFTGDPAIERIDEFTCAAFVKQVSGLPGAKPGAKLSPNTVIKHCVHLQWILNLAGARSRQHRRGQGLFRDEDGRPTEAPYLERPKKRKKAARGNFTLPEIEALLDACQYAPATVNLGGQDPETFFRSLFLFVYNTGLRIDTTMELTRQMVDRERKDWLAIPAEIYKGGCEGGQFYVNRYAREAIEALGLLSKMPDDKLFRWKGWPDSQGWLQDCRRQLLARTAIPEHRRFGFHGLRRTLITWIAPQNAIVASLVAGHKGTMICDVPVNAVTRDHYVNPDTVQQILDRVPQPGQLRQRALFE